MLQKYISFCYDFFLTKTAINTGKLAEEPEYNLSFNPLWSMSAEEEAKVSQTKAQTQQTQANTAKTYFDIGVLDPTEIRKGLAQEGQFCVEDLLENIGASAETADFWGSEDDPDTLPEELQGDLPVSDSKDAGGVGVIVLKDGKVLTGRRTDNGMVCGPGGHIERGEEPQVAAVREAQEEFGITPKNLQALGQLDSGDRPFVFVCTEYDGEPKCQSDEMAKCRWMSFDELGKVASELFPAFKASLGLIPAEMR